MCLCEGAEYVDVCGKLRGRKYVCVHVCILRVDMFKSLNMCVRMGVYVSVCVCVCVCVYVSVYVCVCVCVCVCNKYM